MSTKTKIMLFKARNRMLKVSKNYGSKKNCPLCKISEDTQKHLIECVIIKTSSVRCEKKFSLTLLKLKSTNIKNENNTTQKPSVAIKDSSDKLD